MQQLRPHSVTLILGGVRSGKSRYAQDLAARSERVTFIATAEPREDAEMRHKIERHRADRPQTWATVEEPLRLAAAVTEASQQSQTILIDCLTIFAANLLEAHAEDPSALETLIQELCEVLQRAPCDVILVSNEVGSGVVPAYASGRRFRDLVGELNQRVAAVADTVLLIVAGLPLALKGSVPMAAER
jgi:adenosylcobinamide kinase/adenosylcobinamide-phosphate guanylyltransferase